MINREHTNISKTKVMEEVADPTLLNPIYQSLLTRTVNIDSGFRSNIKPYANEIEITYKTQNLKRQQKAENKISQGCLLSKNSSTNFVATFTDRLSNIISFQLINYTIPYTWYNIDQQYYNNNFLFYRKITDISNNTVSYTHLRAHET